MRKIKEILRLRYGLDLQQQQIAQSCHIGQATVARYLKRFEESGLSWPLPEDCDERRLEELLFDRRGRPVGSGNRPAPDFLQIERQECVT